MSKKYKGTVNEHLIHRIDNMVEADYYEPYKSVRKNVVNNEELFGDSIYSNDTGEGYATGEDSGITFKGVILGLVILSVVIFAVFHILNNI